ncbi:MAG: ABC transporter ATP-binding protein [Gemmatimonadaceae bacterium]|nr:ABC transporter ATP-binding protein [Gemmatimonadaceae bacterium]
MTDAICIRSLDYRAGRDFALRDLDLTVRAGSVYGFLGPNGSGKTTTIKLLMGMLPPEDGTIDVLGHRVPHDIVPALARIGYVPERVHLYPMLSVDETMRHHAAFYPRWDSLEAERLRRAFALRDDALVGRLSKGEAGKLMLLLALAVRPELLVLDEPTDGLDPVVRRDVLAAVVDYVASTRATVFISSHLVHEQERICDWVGVLDAGRMVAELPMSEFRAGIKRLRVRGVAAELPVLPFRVMARRTVLGQDEEWVVRDWRADMHGAFGALLPSASLRHVEDLDLEESFVELLSASRATPVVSRNDDEEAA